jgi:hypothetical protein
MRICQESIQRVAKAYKVSRELQRDQRVRKGPQNEKPQHT